MEKIEKITIKLLMLLIGFSLLFPVRALAAEKDEINEKKVLDDALTERIVEASKEYKSRI